MSHEENLISKLTKEFSRQPGKGVGQAAAKVASDAIKRLEQKAGIEPSRGAPGNQHSVFHNSGQSTHKKPVIPGSGVMPFPAGKAASHQDKEVGAQTGVYDCTGRAITVGAVVGRMIPGRACEDQYLVVTAGLWKVTGYKQPGAAEVVEMKHGANTQGRVGVVLHGISPNVNKGTRVELVPFVGAFTHWKLISGATRDLFLPANVAALVKAQRHNKAGVDDPSGFTKSFHSGEFRIDKSGVSKSESVRTMQAQRQNDWGRTKITEKQDANLAMCPGPSCPTDGPSARHRIMHLGNPFWKYVIVAIVMGTILAYLVSRSCVQAASRAPCPSRSALHHLLSTLQPPAPNRCAVAQRSGGVWCSVCSGFNVVDFEGVVLYNEALCCAVPKAAKRGRCATRSAAARVRAAPQFLWKGRRRWRNVH